MIELYIENLLVDLSDKIDYSIEKSFFDASDPSKLCDNFSKTIKIPMTDKNRKLFGHWEVVDRWTATKEESVSRTGIYFSPYLKLHFVLKDCGQVIMEGDAKFTKCSYSNKDRNYEIQLNGNWNETLNKIKSTTAKDLLTEVYGEDIDCNIWKFTTNSSNRNISNIDNSFRVFPNMIANYYENFNSDLAYDITRNMLREFDRELPITSTKEFRIDKLPLMKSVQSAFCELLKFTNNKLILDPLFFNAGNQYFTKTWFLVHPLLLNYTQENNLIKNTTIRVANLGNMNLAATTYLTFPSNTYLTAFGATSGDTLVKMRPISIAEGNDTYQAIEVTRNSNSMVRCEFKEGLLSFADLWTPLISGSVANAEAGNHWVELRALATATHLDKMYSTWRLTSGSYFNVKVEVAYEGNTDYTTVANFVFCMDGDEGNLFQVPEGATIIKLSPIRMSYTLLRDRITPMGDYFVKLPYKSDQTTLTFTEVLSEEDELKLVSLYNLLSNTTTSRIRTKLNATKGTNGINGTVLEVGSWEYDTSIASINHWSKPNSSVAANRIQAKFNTFNVYLDGEITPLNLLSGLDYMDFLVNYCKTFNLKLLTKEGYNIITTNDRLLGYDPTTGLYGITHNGNKYIKLNYSTIEQEPIFLDSTMLELTYDESDGLFLTQFYSTYDKQYGSFVKKSLNEFSVSREPVYASPYMPAITTAVDFLQVPAYVANGENGYVLGTSVKERMNIINMNNTGGTLMEDALIMVFESLLPTKINHSFWSLSTPEMVSSKEYSYLFKPSENGQVDNYLKKDIFSKYEKENDNIYTNSLQATELIGNYSINFIYNNSTYYTPTDTLHKFGIKNLYHKYLEDLYGWESRKITCKAVVDINRFNWGDLVNINGRDWLVTSIKNWKDANSECDVELISVYDINNYKTLTTIFDEVNFTRQTVIGKADNTFTIVVGNAGGYTEITSITPNSDIELVNKTQIFDDLAVYTYKFTTDVMSDTTITATTITGKTSYIDVIKP